VCGAQHKPKPEARLARQTTLYFGAPVDLGQPIASVAWLAGGWTGHDMLFGLDAGARSWGFAEDQQQITQTLADTGQRGTPKPACQQADPWRM